MIPQKQIVKDWIACAESGDTKQLGKSIKDVETFDLEHFEACTRILMKANAGKIKLDQPTAESDQYYKAGITLIEVLVQKKAAEELVKLAFFSWNTLEKSPLSVRCLDYAVTVGSFDELYDIGHDKLSNKNPKFVECAAHLILKLANAGYEFSYFIAGQILLDGDGVQKSAEEAKKWFLKTAYHGSSRAVLELSCVSDAYLELAKLTPQPLFKNFFLDQAKVCKKAREDLSVMIPGTEVESLVATGENGRVEFKESVAWDVETLRDIAAFLNSSGGCLLIGIEDKNRDVVGLEKSFVAANVQTKDSFERYIVEKALSKLGADCSRLISIDFPACKGQEICRISIASSKKPIYVQEANEQNFYIRFGNSKRKLTTKEAVAYCEEHFEK